MINTLKSVLTALIFAAAALVAGAHSFAAALDKTPACGVPECSDARS